MLKHIESVEQFEELLKNKKVVLDFYADWCGPCRMLSPIIEELAEQYGEEVAIAKLNVVRVGEVAQKYGVLNIPTVIFFKNGEIKETLVGYRPKAHFEKIINLL